MDGYELAARLRERPGEVAPVFVGVSGYGQERDHERSRASGFRCHLVKPADPGAVLAELDHIALDRQRATAAVPR